MEQQNWTLSGILIFICVCALVSLCLWGCPKYKVYAQEKEGEAELAKAQYSREVAVAEAKAKMESAALLAQSDTIRAHGVARANQIIGASITPAYLNWMWMDGLEKQQNVSRIYIPSGQLGLPSQLPITEAGQFQYTSPLQPEQK